MRNTIAKPPAEGRIQPLAETSDLAANLERWEKSSELASLPFVRFKQPQISFNLLTMVFTQLLYLSSGTN
jgi:hypothetical protein